jgi:hypothetical protein
VSRVILEYKNDDEYIMKNTQVSVKRIAIPSGQKGLLQKINESKLVASAESSESVIRAAAKDILPNVVVTPQIDASAVVDEMAALRKMTQSSDYMYGLLSLISLRNNFDFNLFCCPYNLFILMFWGHCCP